MMQAIAPYLLLMATATLFASTRVWRFVDSAAGGPAGRLSAIDGMRGYLALSVMVQHAAMMRMLLTTGKWDIPSYEILPGGTYYTHLGSVAVSLFFMITGFLFWGKLINKDGRPDWIALYVGRVFRLGPVYLIAASCVILIITMHTGFRLNEPVGKIAGELLRWGALGAIHIQRFNGYQNFQLLPAGVLWTLHYEWLFYGMLLPASLFATKRLHLPASLFLLVVAFSFTAAFGQDYLYLGLFSAGMVTASLRRSGLRLSIREPLGSTLVIVLLGSVFVICPQSYGALEGILLAGVFFLICNGATLFGLLTSVASARLGHVSYGIYLLHGFVLWLGFRNPLTVPWVTGSLTQFWGISILAALMLCLASAGIYRLIEYPAIQYGHRLGKRIVGELSKRSSAQGGITQI
jgi:peptidoglycan/LPS O-acetylase OafA/YrhL